MDPAQRVTLTFFPSHHHSTHCLKLAMLKNYYILKTSRQAFRDSYISFHHNHFLSWLLQNIYEIPSCPTEHPASRIRPYNTLFLCSPRLVHAVEVEESNVQSSSSMARQDQRLQTRPAWYKSSLERNENMDNAAVFVCLGYLSPKYGIVGSSSLETFRFFLLVAGSNWRRIPGVRGVVTTAWALGRTVGVASTLTRLDDEVGVCDEGRELEGGGFDADMVFWTGRPCG